MMKSFFNIGDTVKYTVREKSMFQFTTISVVLGLIYPVINDGSAFSNSCSLLSTLFAALAVFYYFTIRNKLTSWQLSFFLCTLIYMLVVGVYHGSLSVSRPILMLTITQDLRYILLFLLGGLYSTSERYMDAFHLIMKQIAFLAVAFGVIAIILILSSGQLIVRGAENHTSYYYWWASTTCFAYWGIYSFLDPKEKQRGLAVLLVYFVVGMAYLKRSCFLNTILIIMISIRLLSKQGRGKKLIRNLFSLSLILFVVSVLIPGVNDIVFGALFERFSDTANDMEDFDRLIEWEVFKQNSSTTQLLMGYGIGNYPIYNRYGIINLDESLLNSLHLGYANVIFKGGILYASFYVLTYLSIFRKWFLTKQFSTRYLACFGVSLSALISLLYEGSWTYTIDPFCISAPIFYVASHTGNSKSISE